MHRHLPHSIFLLAALSLQGQPRVFTPAELHIRLQVLKQVVDTCAVARTTAACDPTLVGEDARVSLPSGARIVEFGWLRRVLGNAGTSKTAKEKLNTAAERLDRELAELDAVAPAQDLGQDRAALQKILASGDFPQPRPPSLWQRLRDEVLRWLAAKLGRAAGAATATRWISDALLIALIAAACGGLVLWFSRMGRKQRVVLPSNGRRPESSATTQPDWQLWLAEARQLALRQQWREAIHRLYWAAIAEMEIRGVWRPDRTRTPREYLALLDPHSEAKSDLTRLTHLLERYWYAGEPAGEQDFKLACGVLERLVA